MKTVLLFVNYYTKFDFFKEFQKQSIFYPAMQCAAVIIHLWSIILPPQLWLLSILKDIWYGNCPLEASWPPMMRQSLGKAPGNFKIFLCYIFLTILLWFFLSFFQKNYNREIFYSPELATRTRKINLSIFLKLFFSVLD